MRTISADSAAILAGFQSTQVRLQVKDAGGTFRDLMTYPTFDAVEEITWGEEIDSLGVQWSATLTREQAKISLSPFMAASPLNHNFDPASSASPLLQVGRLMKVEYSIQANGDPRARSWVLAFQGYIEAINAGGRDTVSIEGRGLEAQLHNAYIERERVYAFAQGAYATKGCYVWDPSRVWALGDLVVPTDSKRNGHFYEVTTAGTGGATEPTYPTGGGSTVADGTATFTERGATSSSTGTAIETVLQQILDDNGFGVVSLWCPTSPSYAVKNFKLNRQPLFEALRNIADGTIGWCLRYMDDAGTPRLKLFDPLRSTTTSLRTFGPTEIAEEGYSRVEVRLKNIRNAVDVTFSDAQDLDASGNPKRKTVSRTDSASITKYGRLFCALAEASTSNIDTTAEATALADRMLSDLAEPTADLEAELLHLFPFVELCDLYTFSADGVHFDSDQKLAVTSYTHRVNARECNTTLRIRGKPASQSAKGWFTMLEDSVGAETHALTALENTTPIVLTADTLPVGGTRIAFDWAQTRNAQDTTFELHLSTSSGFTPSSSTRVAAGKERAFEVGNLNPSTTYYAKLVPITWNAAKPVRGQPSAELSFTPGFLKAAQVSPELTPGPAPLNGGFESWFHGSGSPPDHWAVVTGVWDREVQRSTTAREGTYSVKFTTDTTTAPKIRTSFFPMPAGVAVTYGAWIQKTGTIEASDNLTIAIEFYDSAKALISTASFTTDINSIASGWVRLERGTTAPSGTQFAKVYIAKASALDFQVYVDGVSAVFDDQAWHVVGGTGEPSFSNSWVAYGSGFDPRFRREGNRRWLGGMAKNGSSATAAIFTLPAQDRPTVARTFAIDSAGAFAQLTIDSSGTVTPTVNASTTALSLEGVSWTVD